MTSRVRATPRKVHDLLRAVYGACCGCFLALLAVLTYVVLGPAGQAINVSIVLYLLMLAAGTAGAGLAARWCRPPGDPLLFAGLLAAWVPYFQGATMGVLVERHVSPVLIPGLGLVALYGLTRMRTPLLQAPAPGAARGGAYRRAALFAVLAVLGGVYLVEQDTRARAERVYAYPFLGADDTSPERVPREQIRRVLLEQFGIRPQEEGDVDRCTWRGPVHVYDVVFHYSARGCERVRFRVTPWWSADGPDLD